MGWNAKESGNAVGYGILLLQLQYISMAILLMPAMVSDLTEDDLSSMGLLPPGPPSHNGDQETQHLMATQGDAPSDVFLSSVMRLPLLCVGGMLAMDLVICLGIPLALGRVDLNMLMENTQGYFFPG